jgi:hypothetical protein
MSFVRGMKFKSKIYCCRFDEEAPLKYLMNLNKTEFTKCPRKKKGICDKDNKKCVIFTYMRQK